MELTETIPDLDWEFIDADTQYHTHNIHRYSGKFIPQIARQAIELISNHGDIVLDPFAGSGTTLLESALTGRYSIGIDLNPLAALIAKTKVTPISDEKLNQLFGIFSNLCDELESAQSFSLFTPTTDFLRLVEEAKNDTRYHDVWYQKWFQEPVLLELLLIKREIEKIHDEEMNQLATVAFSDILRKSSNAHTGYPNVMFDKNATARTLPARPFIRSLQECINMVRTLNETAVRDYKPRVITGNNTKIALENESVDAIVTHPPYIGAIPYAEYGILSLVWLGHDSKALDHMLTGGKRQSKDVVDRFRRAYNEMLCESSRLLRTGKKMFIMVGNPVVKGEVIDLAIMTKELSEKNGFELIYETTRTGMNRRANKMGMEYLLFFQKK